MPGKARGPKKAWYGVRTLYRVTAEGKPKSRGGNFDPEATLIEDRIVLFQATSDDDAITQAIKEARSYCRQYGYVNPYGQRVLTRFLDACDAYQISEMAARRPGAGSEVYSVTELVRASVPDSAVRKRRMGKQASRSQEARLKFASVRILRQVLAQMASDSPAKLGAKGRDSRSKRCP